MDDSVAGGRLRVWCSLDPVPANAVLVYILSS